MTEETETKTDGYGKRPMWQWILIYLIIGGLIYYAVYYFAFSKKGGYNASQSTNPYTTSRPTKIPPSSSAMMEENVMHVAINPENGSGQSGTATLKEAEGKTEVTLDLTGYKPVNLQPAHIHVGGCPGVGAVKYPLTSVANGKSVTVLPVTIAQLKRELPLAINVHKSAQDIGAYTACGELK